MCSHCEHRHGTSPVRSELVGKSKANTKQKNVIFTNPTDQPRSQQTLPCRLSSTQLESMRLAMAEAAQWTECRPANLRVTGSTPSQGTDLGYRPGPQ